MLEDKNTHVIHPTAIVSDRAEVAEGVAIGPYCTIGAGVKIGSGSVLHSHVVVAGDTEIGPDCEIFPFASIGHRPQDLKFGGEASKLIVGSGNVIREHVTMNPGTAGGGLLTTVGDNCVFMAASHVAHDCHIGDHVILANNATVAGHCTVGDFAILGGLCGVHQFVRIGRHAFVGGMSGVENDVIPFGSVLGNRAYLGGLNLVGLKRHGFARDTIHALRRAYRMLFEGEGTLQSRAGEVEKAFADDAAVMEVVEFVRQGSDRALCLPRPARAA